MHIILMALRTYLTLAFGQTTCLGKHWYLGAMSSRGVNPPVAQVGLNYPPTSIKDVSFSPRSPHQQDGRLPVSLPLKRLHKTAKRLSGLHRRGWKQTPEKMTGMKPVVRWGRTSGQVWVVPSLVAWDHGGSWQLRSSGSLHPRLYRPDHTWKISQLLANLFCSKGLSIFLQK